MQKTQPGIITLLFRYIIRRINTQHILLILAFLTFGIGDALSAAIMMDARGTGAESNPIAAYVYSSQGFGGFFAAKIWFTIILLMASLITYWNSHGTSYWMVNGFLIALTAGGAMATIANLQAAAGLPHMSASNILFIYLGMVFIFIEVGDFVDKHVFVTSRADNHNSSMVR